MLYLIQLPQYDPNTNLTSIVYKIGYTDNLDRRFREYKSGCLNASIVETRPGNICDEMALHKYLREYKLDEFTEYYPNLDKIKTIFKELPLNFEKIDSKIPSGSLVTDRYVSRLEIYLRQNYYLEDFGDKYNILAKNLYSKLVYENSEKIIDYFMINDHGYKKNSENIVLRDNFKLSTILQNLVIPNEISTSKELDQLFQLSKDFNLRLISYCDFRDNYKDLEHEVLSSIIIPREFHEYYNVLGTKGCRAASFRKGFIQRAVKDIYTKSETDFVKEVKSLFIVGNYYDKKYIKKELQKIYDKHGISKVAKATDLGQIFGLKSAIGPSLDTHERSNGFKILEEL